MSLHIGAKEGQIAETILLPGDPLRAKLLADTYLEDVICYNQIRGMLGFTGTYKGKRVSVQGTGMGIPSHAIYVTELIKDYGCKNLIRVGTCGAMVPEVQLKDIVLAQASCTDSAFNKLTFSGMDYSPIANFELLLNAYNRAKDVGLNVRVGNVFTSDVFYVDDFATYIKAWAEHGVIGVEMETTALYTIAAKYNARALTILSVTDQLVTGDRLTPDERQNSLKQMLELALNSVINL